MRISDVLRRKGDQVVCVKPQQSVTELIDLLAEHGVGALIVSSDGTTLEGIVSERDVVRKLQRKGPELLTAPVSEIMTAKVHSCPPDTDLDDLMRVMTDGRFRHVPVVEEGRLIGIVSIGDVVKNKIDDLQHERDQLEAYITG